MSRYLDFAIGLGRTTEPTNDANRAPRRRAAFAVLLACTILWGVNNIATAIVLSELDCAELVMIRFSIASVAVYLLIAATGRKPRGRDVSAGAVAGIMLFGVICFGVLAVKHTTIAKAATISALYMVLVPVFEVFAGKTRASMTVICSIAISVLGVWLLSGGGGATGLTAGDMYAFACALFSAAHIIAVDRSTKGRDAAWFTLGQLLAVAALGGAWFLYAGADTHRAGAGSLAALFFSAVMPGAVALLAMSKYQKRIDTTTSTLIYNTEPAWAIAGTAMLGHHPGAGTIAGCAMVILGASLPSLLQLKRRSSA